MSQRLSRKEIKQRDSFMVRMGEAFEFVQDHLRTLAWAGIALLGAIVLVAVFLGLQASRQERADTALGEAIRILQAPIDTSNAQPKESNSPSFADQESRTIQAREKFEYVRNEYGRSKAAVIALAYLGELAADAGNLELARSHWEEYLDKGLDNFLANQVAVNLMSINRALGQSDELVTELRARLSGGDTSLPSDLLLFELAKTLDTLGRSEEASIAYQRIISEYPGSVFTTEARTRSGGQAAPVFGGV